MSRITTAILVFVAFGLGAAVGVLGFLWATGGSAEESQDVQAVVATLSLDDPATEPVALSADELRQQAEALAGQISQLVIEDPAAVDPQLAAIATVVAGGGLPAATPEAAEPPIMTEEAAITEEATTEAVEAELEMEIAEAAPRRALFRINPDESEARFLIDEILMGNPITVVGTTDRIAGDIIVNFDQPATSQIGEIAINARTLRTDNEFRDQATRSRILESARDEFEFIYFAPTEFIALTTNPVAVGDTLEFEIIGDLTIKGVTRPVTFTTSLIVTADDRLQGTATTQILYADFGIAVQAPPSVTGIADEVGLEIDFVATLVDQS